MDLLEHLPSRVVVLDQALVDGLDGDVLPCKLVNAESDLPESAFPDEFDELVVVESSRR